MVELEQRVHELLLKQLPYKEKQIDNTLNLLRDGNTIPFIARYRKEMTQALNEVQIAEIQSTYQKLLTLEQQKEQIIAKLVEQNKLTTELKNNIQNSTKLSQLEEIYQPYKQKRRTKAMIAKENGLEPLANQVLQKINVNITEEITKYFNANLTTEQNIIDGVIEIIAEKMNENLKLRKWIQKYLEKNAIIMTNRKKKWRK